MANEPAPRVLKVALGLLLFQAVANGYSAFTVQDEVGDRLDHGQEVDNLNLVNASVYLSYVLAVALLVTVPFLITRRPWAQYPVYVVEALVIALGLVLMMATANLGGLLGLAIAAVVLIGVSRPEVTEWLDPEPDDDNDDDLDELD